MVLNSFFIYFMYLTAQMEVSKILKNKDQIFYLFYIFKNIQFGAKHTVKPEIYAWLQVECHGGYTTLGSIFPLKPHQNGAYINGADQLISL